MKMNKVKKLILKSNGGTKEPIEAPLVIPFGLKFVKKVTEGVVIVLDNLRDSNIEEISLEELVKLELIYRTLGKRYIPLFDFYDVTEYASEPIPELFFKIEWQRWSERHEVDTINFLKTLCILTTLIEKRKEELQQSISHSVGSRTIVIQLPKEKIE